MMGVFLFGFMFLYPLYAYFQHSSGEATNMNYIILGMAIMCWVNLFVGITTPSKGSDD